MSKYAKLLAASLCFLSSNAQAINNYGPGKCANAAWKAMVGYHLIVEGTYTSVAGNVKYVGTDTVVAASIKRMQTENKAYTVLDTSEGVYAEGTHQGRNYEKYSFFNDESIEINVTIDPRNPQADQKEGCFVTDVSIGGEH